MPSANDDHRGVLSRSSSCRRCGECCRSGGPTLHAEDLPTLESGLIRPEHLFTMRSGEFVHDNAGSGSIIPLEAEMIKIAGQGGAERPWHCVFHGQSGCAVYAGRPAQCRALFCGDSGSLREVLAGKRLSRREILPLYSPQWLELALAHEQECRLDEFGRLAASKAAEDRETLRELLRFDAEFRNVAAERELVPFEAAPLVFGRSLAAILGAMR